MNGPLEGLMPFAGLNPDALLELKYRDGTTVVVSVRDMLEDQVRLEATWAGLSDTLDGFFDGLWKEGEKE